MSLKPNNFFLYIGSEKWHQNSRGVMVKISAAATSRTTTSKKKLNTKFYCQHSGRILLFKKKPTAPDKNKSLGHAAYFRFMIFFSEQICLKINEILHLLKEKPSGYLW